MKEGQGREDKKKKNRDCEKGLWERRGKSLKSHAQWLFWWSIWETKRTQNINQPTKPPKLKARVRWATKNNKNKNNKSSNNHKQSATTTNTNQQQINNNNKWTTTKRHQPQQTTRQINKKQKRNKTTKNNNSNNNNNSTSNSSSNSNNNNNNNNNNNKKKKNPNQKTAPKNHTKVAKEVPLNPRPPNPDSCSKIVVSEVASFWFVFNVCNNNVQN